MTAERRVRGHGRELLLGAAAECFAERGYAGFTLEEVRERAGVSVGTAYHHFPAGREDLEGELYLKVLAEYQDALIDELERHRSAAAGTKGVVVFHLDWIAGNLGLAGLLLAFRSSWLTPDYRFRLDQLNLVFAQRAGNWLKPHVEAERIQRLSPELYGSIVLGPAQAYGGQIMSSELDPLEIAAALRNAASRLADAAWRAVQGPSERS
jgi:AcrR family transcriptional regulator